MGMEEIGRAIVPEGIRTRQRAVEGDISWSFILKIFNAQGMRNLNYSKYQEQVSCEVK